MVGRRKALLLAGMLSVALMAQSRAARGSGDETPPAELVQIQKDGKAALKQGRLEDAIGLFQQGLAKSEEETTTWHMLLGLALAHELNEDWVPAATNYQAFLSRSADHAAARTGRWAARRRSATEDVAKLESDVLATHALVSLMTEPTGVTITASGSIDGPESKTPLALYLPPGQHQLELVHEGFVPMILVVSVDHGQRVTIQRALVPAEEQAAPVAKPDPPPPEEPTRSRPEPAATVLPPPPESSPILAALGWSMAGLGVAALGAGVGFTVAAANTTDDLEELQRGSIDEASLADDQALRTQLRDLQAGAVGFYAAGGSLAIGGALVLLLRPNGPLDVAPTVGIGVLGAQGRF